MLTRTAMNISLQLLETKNDSTVWLTVALSEAMVIISFYLLVIYHLYDLFVLCYGFAVLFVFGGPELVSPVW